MFRALVISSFALLLASAAEAAPLLSEAFTTAPASWYYVNATGSPVVADDSAGIGSGNALNVDHSRVAIAAFAPRTLANIGDSISVTASLRRAASYASNSGAGYALGLYSSNGTPITGVATAATQSDNDIGYNLAARSATTTHSDGIKVRRETGTSPFILGGSDLANLGSTVSGYNDRTSTTPFTLSMTITRVANGLEFTGVFGGLVTTPNTVTVVDTAPLTYTFDEVVFRSTSGSFYLDNVVVVPEPATAALLALGAVGMLVRRRAA